MIPLVFYGYVHVFGFGASVSYLSSTNICAIQTCLHLILA
jgi:hypothetical protein